MSSPIQFPRCKTLILDAGPLVSLSPLRGLAETYVTVPEVLAELKDTRAKQHFERLGLISGVNIKIQSPDPASLTHVIQFAKGTGDYNVLSHADLCVLAMTYALHEQDEAEEMKKTDETDNVENGTSIQSASRSKAPAEKSISTLEEVASALENLPLEDNSEQLGDPASVQVRGDASIAENLAIPSVEENRAARQLPMSPRLQTSEPIFDDPSDSDDDEGEWITPSNVALHKSRALNLLPDAHFKRQSKVDEVVHVGCMTADFAMQNVLLQMGLNLVGLEGKRIKKVKTWVLRCHACFNDRICKDISKKFCHSCGNPTLLRTSVTVSAPGASADAPVIQVHLKRNFQYKNRGTKYSIPAPKPGSAKTGSGNNLILREDQPEYMKAKKRLDSKREREETKMLKGILDRGVDGAVEVGSRMDPDWVPEIISVGISGKGRITRSAGMDGGLPQIGYGKKNPNERRRRK